MSKERDEFVAVLAQELPGMKTEDITDFAGQLIRYSKEHGRWMERDCNEGLNEIQMARVERLENKIRVCVNKYVDKSLKPMSIAVRFSGDPRGYTCKLLFVSGRYNTWGGKEEGYGIPQ